MRHLFLALLTLLVSSSFGLTQIGVHDLNQFPNIIQENQNYNFGVYVHNQGSSSITKTIVLKIQVVGKNTFTLTTFNNPGGNSWSLDPGDSIFVPVTNKSFTKNHFGSGVNDIIVWPECPNNSGNWSSDSASKQILFNEQAEFMIAKHTIKGLFQEHFNLDSRYNILLGAANTGNSPNRGWVEYYAEIKGLDPIMIGTVEKIALPGETLYLPLDNFMPGEFIGNYCKCNDFSAFKEIEFWAKESDTHLSNGKAKNLSFSVALVEAKPFEIRNIIQINNGIDFKRQLEHSIPEIRLSPIRILNLSGFDLDIIEFEQIDEKLASLKPGFYFLKTEHPTEGSIVIKVLKN